MSWIDGSSDTILLVQREQNGALNSLVVPKIACQSSLPHRLNGVTYGRGLKVGVNKNLKTIKYNLTEATYHLSKILIKPNIKEGKTRVRDGQTMSAA